jgi:hypothetical protein
MEKSQMFEKNPKNGMNLIFLNLLETYDKNHNLYIESLKSSKSETSKRIFQINSVISFGKKALEKTIDFYISEFQKQIEKIKKLSEGINGAEDFESFLQLDVSKENLKLLALNKFIQDQTNLIEKIKCSESFKKLRIYASNDANYDNNAYVNNYFGSFKNENYKKFEIGYPFVSAEERKKFNPFQDRLIQKFNAEDKKSFKFFEKEEENKKEEFKAIKVCNSPSRYKKKFPSFAHKQGKISNKNLCDIQSACLNENNNENNFEGLLENDNIFNTEIIRNIEEFGKSMNKECKLLNQKRFKDDSLIDSSKDFIYKKKTKEEKKNIKQKEYEEDIKNHIKVLSESSKSATVHLKLFQF